MEIFDVEKIEKTIVYVNRIAYGKDPVTDVLANDGDVLNNPDVIRCMFFIKDVLSAVKNNGGVIGRTVKTKKKPFPLDSLSSFQYQEKKTITKLTEQLNAQINTNEYTKLQYKAVTDWLKRNEYLTEAEDDTLGKKVTISTEKGNLVGITHSLQTSMSGISYYRVEYDRAGQEFVIRNLPAMLNENDNGSKEKKYGGDDDEDR